MRAFVVNHLVAEWYLGWVISFNDIGWSAVAGDEDSTGDPWSEEFPWSKEGFPRSHEGLPLGFAARPSDVSLDDRSRRLLILGSTRPDWFGTTLPSVSTTGCPIDELGTSALSPLLRRLTEGVLEARVPTSVDTGVTSCLLLNAEPVFGHLRDDLLDFLSAWHSLAVLKCKGVKEKRSSISQELQETKRGNEAAAGNCGSGKTQSFYEKQLWHWKSGHWARREKLFETRKTLQTWTTKSYWP